MANVVSDWAIVAAGSMRVADQVRRGYAVQFVQLFSFSVEVWWTDDGTPTGTTLFGDDDHPLVVPMYQPNGAERDWQQGYRAGPMFRPQDMNALISIPWQTEWASTEARWRTTLFKRGDPEITANGADDDRGVLCILHAFARVI